MKIASIIFICLGMVTNFSVNTLLGVIGVIVGIFTLISLGKGKKSIALGVLSLIFTGLIGGILYLCWNPEKTTKGE